MSRIATPAPEAATEASQATLSAIAAKLGSVPNFFRVLSNSPAALGAHGALSQTLGKALDGGGLSLVHVPVYFGDDPLGGLGAWGDWNVGSWVDDVQDRIHGIGL